MTNEELIEKVQEHLFGLKWAIDVYGDHVAPTPLGDYRVSDLPVRGWTWSYCFTVYHDECNTPCDGPESGKAAAQADYNKRVNAYEEARAVTKIVGEACARSVHSIAHSTISERELLDAIKSLTQGKET